MIRLSRARKQAARQRGFSVIELLIAMFVLTIGLLGGMVIIVAAMATNSRNRQDTAAVALAQSVMDRIIVLSTDDPNQTTQMTDCLGNTSQITTAPGGAPLLNLNTIANGTQIIDFSQAPVQGYQMFYAVCANGAQDGGPLGNPQIYEVRWNIQAGLGTGGVQLVQVAARSPNETGNGGSQMRFFNLPVTLRGLRGN